MNPQDPLANLQPLRQPELVHWWPPAPGWWLLLALLLLCLAAGVYLLYRRYSKNAYRRQALAQLQQLQAQFEHNRDAGAYATAVNALLKSVALVTYPRREVASEYGESWLTFLNDSLKPQDHFQPDFAVAAYSQAIEQLDVTSLQHAASTWIKQHRVTA